MDMSRKLQTFGGRLELLRGDLHMTQSDVVEQLRIQCGIKIGRTYISELERGWEENRMPTLEVAAGLAKILNTTTDYLGLLTDVSMRPGQDEDGQNYFTAEADEAAKIIDSLPAWRKREVLAVIKAMKASTDELQASADQAASEMHAQLAQLDFNQSVLGEREMTTIYNSLLEFAAHVGGPGSMGGSNGLAVGKQRRVKQAP